MLILDLEENTHKIQSIGVTWFYQFMQHHIVIL